MKYLIVSSPNLEGLMAIVNENMNDGWIPQGAPFVVGRGQWLQPEDDKGKRIAQALVKKE